MRAVSKRDAGLALISRINRWLVAGAITLTGAVSVAAAKAFRGHTQRASGASVAAPAPAAPQPSSGDQGNGLQQPTQAPAPAPAAPSAPVSGGS